MVYKRLKISGRRENILPARAPGPSKPIVGIRRIC
jgi:hypothetical protein